MAHSESSVIGLLLAAGRGRRFDAQGRLSKLLARPVDLEGVMVAAASARSLRAVLPVLAVVEQSEEVAAANRVGLADCLRDAGCTVVACADAALGMSASLKAGLLASGQASGWIVALADMPYVQVATVAALVAALEQGADLAVPVQDGRRGNPVGISRLHLQRLLALEGDRGARGLLQEWPVVEVLVDDAGIHRDIDTQADLG